MESDKRSKIKAIICILVASFGFSLMSFFVRISGDLPTMQKAFFRNFFALIVALIPLLRSKEKIKIKEGCFWDILMRCVFGTIGLVSNFYAVDRLNIADANMLNKLSPFFAIVISVFVLSEIPSPVDITATIVAFIGALFIIRPGGNMPVFPGLIGLLGGFGAGTAYVFVRKLGRKGERTSMIVLCHSAFSSAITLPFLILDYHPMSLTQSLCLVGAGLAAALGQFGITTAYRYAPAKEISVFDYTQVIFAAILGMIFLGETPVLMSLIGYVLIIGTAAVRWWYTLHSEDKDPAT